MKAAPAFLAAILMCAPAVGEDPPKLEIDHPPLPHPVAAPPPSPARGEGSWALSKPEETDPDREQSGPAADDFKAAFRRDDTKLEFLTEQAATVFDIQSEFGIDRGTIARRMPAWPKNVLVRLHLRGMESFKAGNERVTIEWSAGREGAAARVTLWQGRREQEIDEDDPYFTAVRVVEPQDEAPENNGFFEVPLPAKLFDGNPAEIKLQWIDFYRG